jgi:NAD-dependent SIR2 family protein deacetylase
VTGRPPAAGAATLADFVLRHPRLLVLTGAGCSTASGIPDYRDADGRPKHRRPILYADFVRSPSARRRYWARSLRGWPRVAHARPNHAHRALMRLEARGRVGLLVTQNVDGLHQKAGSLRVLDLHGRLDAVECLGCGARFRRDDVQALLIAWNRRCADLQEAAQAPDGDAQLEDIGDDFRVPDCRDCGGVLKPGVVLFGESVPRQRVAKALGALAACDALLVVGSSLTVYSGYRFCLAARELGKPVAAINLGRTRAEDLLTLKAEAECGAALGAMLEELDARGGEPQPLKYGSICLNARPSLRASSS